MTEFAYCPSNARTGSSLLSLATWKPLVNLQIRAVSWDIRDRATTKGHLRGLGVEHLPLAQVMTLGSWDRVPHQAGACFSLCLCLCLSLSLSLFLMNKYIKSLKKRVTIEIGGKGLGWSWTTPGNLLYKRRESKVVEEEEMGLGGKLVGMENLNKGTLVCW